LPFRADADVDFRRESNSSATKGLFFSHILVGSGYGCDHKMIFQSTSPEYLNLLETLNLNILFQMPDCFHIHSAGSQLAWGYCISLFEAIEGEVEYEVGDIIQ
jgi:hypothetical protein